MKPITILAFLFLVLAVRADQAEGKSFMIDRLHSDVQVDSDGSARITESITYRFDGKFSYAFRNIPLRAADRVSDVQVSEAGSEYSRSTSRVPGSYTVERSGDDVVVTWYYRARNETRTFEIAYTLADAVVGHGDVADFYYTIFNNLTGSDVGEVSTTVTLPERVAGGELQVFAHGPLYGGVRIVSDNTVAASVSPLPVGAFFDVRILTPLALFPSVSTVDQETREQILAEERTLAEEADRRRSERAAEWKQQQAERIEQARRARELFPVAMILGLVALGAWFACFRAYGMPHHVASHTVPGEMPSDRPPAMVSFLLARSVGGPALVATIVDLAERGFLTVNQTRSTKTGWRGKTSFEEDYRFDRVRGAVDKGLRPYERSLLEFMVGDVGDGRGFAMSDLKAYARKHRRDVQKWFAAWMKAVKEESAGEGFFEPYPVSVMIINAAVGLAVVTAGAVICAVTSSPAGVPAIVGGFVQMVLTGALSRRSPEGQRELIAWKEFRRHLRKTAKARGVMTLGSRDWSRYLAAAILFGLHKEIVPFLQVSDVRGTHAFPVWYAGMASSGGTDASGLADGFSAMVSAMSSTVASSTGSGGGASGGGGGGVGGGSAGAG